MLDNVILKKKWLVPDIIVGFSDMEQNKKLMLWSHSTHGLILIHKYKKKFFICTVNKKLVRSFGYIFYNFRKRCYTSVSK